MGRTHILAITLALGGCEFAQLGPCLIFDRNDRGRLIGYGNTEALYNPCPVDVRLPDRTTSIGPSALAEKTSTP